MEDVAKFLRESVLEVKKLEISRNDRLEHMSEYFEYVLSKVKSQGKSGQVLLVDSPETRRKKLRYTSVNRNEEEQKEVAGSSTQTSAETKRKKLEYTTTSVNRNEEEQKEVAGSSTQASAESRKTVVNKLENSSKTEKEVERRIPSDEDENHDETLKDNNDRTLTSSGCDMFDAEVKENETSPVLSNKQCEDINVMKDDKLNMEAVVVIERIILTDQQKSNVETLPINNKTFSLEQKEDNEQLCATATVNKVINRETLVLKESNGATASSNPAGTLNRELNQENISDSISNEKTLKITDPLASSSSYQVTAGCRLEQEIDTTETSPSDPEKPPTQIQSLRKEYTNSEEQTRGRPRSRVLRDGATDRARSITTPLLQPSRSKSASSERKVQTGGRSVVIKNRMLSPAFGKPIPTSASKVPVMKAIVNKLAVAEAEQKRKEEEIRKRKQKEEEALKNREQLIKAKTEQIKRKREYKIQKVVATRVAVEKEKSATLAKMEKEKEEKERIKRLEMEKAREELLKKKLLHQQKLQEAEERRLREENARIQRLKEQEEEQKRLAEMKQKQQEEAEKLALQRKLDEREPFRKEECKTQKQMAAYKVEHKDNDGACNSYDITPQKKYEKERLPIDEDNYGIDDLNTEDSEDEDNPRKTIPKWARREERMFKLKIQSYLTDSLVNTYFQCPSKSPNLKEFFGKYTRERARTSSAIWNTPPMLSKNK